MKNLVRVYSRLIIKECNKFECTFRLSYMFMYLVTLFSVHAWLFIPKFDFKFMKVIAL